MSEEHETRLAAMKADLPFMAWLNDYFGGDGSWESEYSGTWFSLHDAWEAGAENQRTEDRLNSDHED